MKIRDRLINHGEFYTKTQEYREDDLFRNNSLVRLYHDFISMINTIYISERRILNDNLR